MKEGMVLKPLRDSKLTKYLTGLGLLLFLNACTPALLLLGQQVPLNFEPFLSHNTIVRTLAESQAIKSDKRPMAAGFYDETVDKTFVAWLGARSNSYVQAYDHEFATWESPKRVTAIERSAFFEGPDRHNYPTLIQADDGKLLLFYAEHSNELRLSISPEAHSLEGLWNDTVLKQAPHASYPMPVKTKKGDIYVFYRESSFLANEALNLDDRPMQYILSKDNGKTWRNAKDLTGEDIALGSWDSKDNLDEIYMAQIRYQPRTGLNPERIHMVWTLAGGGREGPKHDRYHKDMYYAYFRPSNKHFYCAGGKDKGTSLNPAEMADCLVEDSGSLNQNEPQAVSYIQLVHYSDNGKPIVIYQLNKENGSTIRSASWTGRNWIYSDISNEGFILDMEKLDSDSFRFYAGNGKIQEFETNDAGKSWTRSNDFSLPDTKRVLKLTAIDGAKDPARLLITDVTTSTTPSANVYLAGEARCLIEGNYHIKSASGDYLSIAGFDDSTALKQLTVSPLDNKDKRQQWRVQDNNGSCLVTNNRINAYLNLSEQGLTLNETVNENTQWLITGTPQQNYQFKHLNSQNYLHVALGDDKMTLTASELEENNEATKSPNWTLEPIN